MRRFVVVSAGALVVLLGSAGSALAASGQPLCVGSAGSAVTTPVSANRCKSGQKLITLATQSEVTTSQSQVAALQTKLSTVSYSASGLNGKPTLTVSGANLQVDSGSGSTSGTVNGLGNVIIGYDESPQTQTGSNNLVLGELATFSSYGGIVGGFANTLSGPDAVVFGQNNTASGYTSSVSGGGSHNTASGAASSVSGGGTNIASGAESSVSGGFLNTASNDNSSVAGGCANLAGTGTISSNYPVCYNSAGFPQDFVSVAGGMGNQSDGQASAISGGNSNTASGTFGAWVGGGFNNKSSGSSTSMVGGNGETLTGPNNESQVGPTLFGP